MSLPSFDLGPRFELNLHHDSIELVQEYSLYSVSRCWINLKQDNQIFRQDYQVEVKNTDGFQEMTAWMSFGETNIIAAVYDMENNQSEIKLV
jgi:hypothetical protein